MAIIKSYLEFVNENNGSGELVDRIGNYLERIGFMRSDEQRMWIQNKTRPFSQVKIDRETPQQVELTVNVDGTEHTTTVTHDEFNYFVEEMEAYLYGDGPYNGSGPSDVAPYDNY